MAEVQDYNIADLLKFAHEGKPNDFSQAFDAVAKDRIGLAIDARREEIANQMMNGVEEEEIEEFDTEDLAADNEVESEEENE